MDAFSGNSDAKQKTELSLVDSRTRCWGIHPSMDIYLCARGKCMSMMARASFTSLWVAWGKGMEGCLLWLMTSREKGPQVGWRKVRMRSPSSVRWWRIGGGPDERQTASSSWIRQHFGGRRKKTTTTSGRCVNRFRADAFRLGFGLLPLHVMWGGTRVGWLPSSWWESKEVTWCCSSNVAQTHPCVLYAKEMKKSTLVGLVG